MIWQSPYGLHICSAHGRHMTLLCGNDLAITIGLHIWLPYASHMGNTYTWIPYGRHMTLLLWEHYVLQYEAHHPRGGGHQDDRDRHGHEHSRLICALWNRTTYRLAPGTGPHYLEEITHEDSYAPPRGMLLMMMMICHRLMFSRFRYPYFLCHWEQRSGGNPKLVGMSENHSVDMLEFYVRVTVTGFGFTRDGRQGGAGSQGATMEPRSEYVECSVVRWCPTSQNWPSDKPVILKTDVNYFDRWRR